MTKQATPADTTKADIERLGLTAQVAVAFLSHHNVAASEVPNVLRSIHSTLGELAGAPPTGQPIPQVPVKKSVTDDFIICLEDGKKLRTLKRYLRTQYDMSPDDYRAKWQLPRDYPMVAPSYTRLRSAFATKIGLGTKSRRGGRKPRTPKD